MKTRIALEGFMVIRKRKKVHDRRVSTFFPIKISDILVFARLFVCLLVSFSFRIFAFSWLTIWFDPFQQLSLSLFLCRTLAYLNIRP